MRTLIALLLLSCCTIAQPMNEKQAIQKDKIDLKKEYLFFIIHGTIEINGHSFINDTGQDPVMFEARITGIAIKRRSGSPVYEFRDCGDRGCGIVHLEEKRSIKVEPYYGGWRLYNGL